MKQLLRSFSTRFAILTALGFCSLTASAQRYYVFAGYLSSYQNLSNATVLTTDLSQSNYLYQLPAVFKMFGKELSANLVVGKNGFVVNTGSTNSFAFDPFLADIQPIGSTSSISAKIEYTTADTILKIEWNNVTLNGLPSGNYLNFQAWLYKNTETIEFRYGPSMITATSPTAIQPLLYLYIVPFAGTPSNVCVVFTVVSSTGNCDVPVTVWLSKLVLKSVLRKEILIKG